MSNRDRALRKIKKLFAMANDVGSPEEAVIAARQARALMDKHDIAQYEVEQFRGDNKFGEVKHGKAYRYMPVWISILSVQVAVWNDCQSTMGSEMDAKWPPKYRKFIKFRGLEADAITARVMMEYLQETIGRLARQQGYGSNAKLLTAFKLGASREVCARIRDLIEKRAAELHKTTGTDLVVIKQQLVAEEFGEAEYCNMKLEINDDEAYEEGREAGKKINLHIQVQGDDAPVGVE